MEQKIDYKIGDDIVCINNKRIYRSADLQDELTVGKIYKALSFTIEDRVNIINDKDILCLGYYTERFVNARIKQFKDEMKEIIDGE